MDPYGASGEEGNASAGMGWTGPGSRPEPIPQGPGGNPYPNTAPSFVPYLVPANGGRPEPGDPLYTSPGDGPELKLISLQLSGPENYSTWARDLRRALVTKEKDGFLDGTVPFPADERSRRHWRRCNQLVRTWIGNCLAPEVAAGLPPTEDSKTIWENIRKMYGKLDRAKIFSLTQAVLEISGLKFLRWNRRRHSAGFIN